MKNTEFSFVILTLNEEQNLPRLLQSIELLNASIYILDSGSTDLTLDICKKHQIEYQFHSFKNHPTQWHIALNTFNITTPWVIALDADQIVTPELLKLLTVFRDDEHQSLQGIYFNRKYYFKGKWIRYGGHYPKYLLKMFRYKIGYSDLKVQMDHKFLVPGKTIIWKKGYLKEENLKENKISFWIDKHNTYSELLAKEEIEFKPHINIRQIKPILFQMPNEHSDRLKSIWRQMPVYLRSLFYFIYRIIFQLGFLDGKTGIIYHFLQGFWFRLIVDIKIEENRQQQHKAIPVRADNGTYYFLIKFIILFGVLFGLNLSYIALVTPGGFYSNMLDHHLNYINAWRQSYIIFSAKTLEFLNYTTTINTYGLTVKGYSGFKLVYSCLGYGIMSCFSAFVIAFPKCMYSKIYFLFLGLTGIYLLNVLRFVLIAIYYNPKANTSQLNHHNLFNYSIYGLLAISIYLWTSKKTRIKC